MFVLKKGFNHIEELTNKVSPHIVLDVTTWLDLLLCIQCGNAAKERHSCQGKLTLCGHQSCGEVISIFVRCVLCLRRYTFLNVHSTKIKSYNHKQGPGLEQFHLEIVSSFVLNGKTWRDYERERHQQGLQCMSYSTFRRAEKWIWTVVQVQATKSCDNEIELLL